MGGVEGSEAEQGRQSHEIAHLVLWIEHGEGEPEEVDTRFRLHQRAGGALVTL